MFELNISGGFNLHNIDEDVTQSNIGFLEFEVALVEFPEVLLVHVADGRIVLGGTWVISQVLLISLKICSMMVVDLSCSFSGTAPSSKKVLMAFWMFHLVLTR